ncbi:MAG TPA: ATP-binding protein [Gemmatimonadales bacterium]|nr:ATP-binding protein [Gemmatimonadales bacterium]
MTQSGVTQTVEAARARFREGIIRPGWRRAAETVWGPLLTLATLILLDLLTRAGMPVLYPFPVLLLTVAISAFLGGLRTALVSAVLTVLYGVHFFSEPGLPLRYRPSGAYSLLVIGLAAPALAVLVSRLHGLAERGRAAELSRAEAEALDRRVSLMSQASATLASSLDYEVTLRELARLLVPALGDWCAIHAIGEGGVPRFLAGAHRDPARDLLVRALCEYGDRRIPFGLPARSEPVEVTDRLIHSLAQDDEHRKLYRALRPSWVLGIPLRAQGRIAGVITLGMSREYARRFEEQDIHHARELGDRVALAVGAGHVFHAARDADRRYRMLFDANPQPMWIFDVETLEFLAVNDAAVRHYGYTREEFLGMSIMDIKPAEEPPGPPVAGQARRPEAAFTRHQRKDGTVMDVELVSHELEMDGRRARLVLATDISDRTRIRAALHHSQEQLRQAQRLDAVGRLAAGIAHDFNNILTTIRGFGDILYRDLAEDDPRRADADQIRKAADRGVVLTGQLLAFGQRQVPNPQLLDLNDVIRSMEGLIRQLLGADIRVELRLLQGPATLLMDPGHLDQLLVNIILNARDAMPQGGTLTIETGERQIAEGSRSRRVRPGTYVLLAIHDTGTGMDPEAASHLFEPFQGDDPRTHRAGLGLSIVYGIVRQTGGVVRVSSEPGEGTTIKVYLPKAELDEPEIEQPAELRGRETVLVVEDEEGVRELVRQILVEHGHAVLTARHGRDALLIAERYERPIDLLVTDVVMPEMGGGELVERLTALRPDLKVLYISGYTNDEVVRRGIPGVTTGFLHKPFTADALMRRVREVLEGAPSAT